MKLQGLGLIDITLNHWLKKYGFNARVRGVDEDFFWYHDDTISYSFYFPTEAADNWAKLMEELNCGYNIDIFFSAFLHELGHSLTYWSFDDDEIDEYNETCQLIAEDPSSFCEDLDYLYTHLPIEYEATTWAVNYINTYPDRVQELVSLVSKAINLFYTINNVIDDEPFDFS